MRNTINNQEKQKGFTLIEMSISVIILGIIMISAISYYSIYKKEKAIEQTDRAIAKTLNALGGFRSVYGRYPCPAPYDARRGDVAGDYGREECTASAAGACTNGVCTDASTRIAGVLPAPHLVLRGTVPFRSMNLQESDVYDGYGQRLTYAITDVLTDNTTYNPAQGGITIVDENNNNLVEPAGSAHFVIISHGENRNGSYSIAGTQIGACPVATNEEENCDADTTYRSSLKDNSFDDVINYFSSVKPQQWQRSSVNDQDIHLKTGTLIAVGTLPTTDLTGAERVEIELDRDSAEGVLLSDGGVVLSTQICKYDGDGTATDCFLPELIAGQIASGEGMTCPSGEFMTGIQNGGPVCAAEVFVSCPSGDFISGVKADGTVECNSSPPAECLATTMPNSCGGTSSLAGTFSGGFEVDYTGQCYNITNRTAGYFSGQLLALFDSDTSVFISNMNGLISTLNAETRTMSSCGTTAANAQIRDAYECVNGAFIFRRAHERRWYTMSSDPFPSSVTTGSSSWPAETSVAYGPTVDLSNTNGYHDCWCREDYRMQTSSCPSGFSGNTLTIQKHNCPQTAHNWQTIITDTSSCTCTPGTTTTSQSCAAYYGLPAGAITGTVVSSYNVTCPGPVTAAIPFNVDTSACSCPTNSLLINRTSCPVGTTNNFTWIDPASVPHTETAEASITTQEWSCSGTPSSGSYGPTTPVAGIPACVCDTTLTDIEWLPCPDPTTSGPGLKYERDWDCATSNWEPFSDWTLLDNQCYSCLVEAPAGAPTLETVRLGGFANEVGNACNCSTPSIAFCNAPNGGNFDVWTSCGCVMQGP